jgi:hypothetical protein
MAKSQAASSFGAKIAEIAKGEVGQDACSRKTASKKGYFTSCHSDGDHGPPQFWCADFVRWVWWKAGALDTAPGTHVLTPESGSFATYGAKHGKVRLRRKPRVGDAVLFNYNKNLRAPDADHVAIVVKVNANGTIRSVSGDIGGQPGSDAHFAATAHVVLDKAYNSAPESRDSRAPNGPLSGYVSPVEDDMPYSKQQIRNLVKQGVAAELHAGLDASGITAAQGAEAAVHTQRAFTDLATQVSQLKDLVTQALAAATPPATPPPATPPPAIRAGASPSRSTPGRRAGPRTPASPPA